MASILVRVREEDVSAVRVEQTKYSCNHGRSCKEW